jgi:hypothetical protein
MKRTTCNNSRWKADNQSKDWRMRRGNTHQSMTRFKTHKNLEWAVTWWNPSAQMCPVLDSSSFGTVFTLPHTPCLHSATSVLAVCRSCHIIALFVFRKPLFIN